MRTVERGDLVRALSYLTVPALFGPVVGPPIGGFITTYFHWRWIFWINVPIGVVGIFLATLFIEDVREDNPGPLDIVGFVLSGFGLALLLFGLAVAGGGLVADQRDDRPHRARRAGLGGLCRACAARPPFRCWI